MAPPEDELWLEQKRVSPRGASRSGSCVTVNLMCYWSAYVCRFYRVKEVWGSTWGYWSFTSSFQLNCAWNEVCTHTHTHTRAHTHVYLHKNPWWMDGLICLEFSTVFFYCSFSNSVQTHRNVWSNYRNTDMEINAVMLKNKPTTMQKPELKEQFTQKGKYYLPHDMSFYCILFPY